jgi:cyclic pyranopterin phosphate synthase
LATKLSPKLTHFDRKGSARMVDVGAKPETRRIAIASGRILMKPATFRMVVEGSAAKGDVLGVARIAGIQAAKRTAEWIPLAHPLGLDSVEVAFESATDGRAIRIEARAATSARTGVEMEALVAVAGAALTIYDMCKSIDRSMTVGDLALWEKAGGRSGTYRRQRDADDPFAL